MAMLNNQMVYGTVFVNMNHISSYIWSYNIKCYLPLQYGMKNMCFFKIWWNITMCGTVLQFFLTFPKKKKSARYKFNIPIIKTINYRYIP